MRPLPIVALTAAVLLNASISLAGRHDRHKVKPGESIAAIALFHGVLQDDLRNMNDLGEGDEIHPGDVLQVPKILIDGWMKGHTVKKGDTVRRIARKYRVDEDELKQINRIGKKGWLRLGRRLVIPKGKQVDGYSIGAVEKAGSKTEKKTKKKWNGKATVVRVRGKSERKTMTMFDKRGRVRTYAQRTISRLARSKKNKVRRLNRRLIALLGRVAEHYPGKDIEIISGYRPHKRGHKRSQHSRARAVDFRVRGVPNLELYNYLKSFKKVGVGYYPNSTFVHLDSRDKKFTWTDVSGPNEKARYVKPGEAGSGEAESDALESGEPDPENFPEDNGETTNEAPPE